ncbi:HAMP domain-containing histidine kinase [Cetobacterium sp. 8H]|uniref:sensor histidine kinase n=1 Tax=Cetobacterium sp. 8H TaxID=2759681 RepID=UPI00163D04A2|nr:HAMP domain-containing sensor histidine kinase [Cetobacterium sp. 8H]MBC2850262.1 HAMP domain-containing histidine kinase [Cetobacterium sp. 8H]
MKRTSSSISKKMFFYSVGIIIVAMLVSYGFNIFFLDLYYKREIKKDFPEIAIRIERYLEKNETETLEKYIKLLREKNGITILIMEENEKKWNNSRGGSGKGFSLENLKSEEFIIKKQRETEAEIIVYNRKVLNNRWISVRTSLSVLDYYKNEMGYFNILGTVIAILISLICSRIFSKKVIEDIERLSRKAEDISNLKFDKNNLVERDDELGKLGKNLEKMSFKLEKSIKDLESFVSNSSHELKTPIAIISSNAELLIKEDIENKRLQEKCRVILRESFYMKELISKLLTLSKIGSLTTLEKKSINLEELIKGILERYDYIEFSKNLEIKLNGLNENIVVDKDFFSIALENIIHNALKYSEQDSVVKINYNKNLLEIENEAKNIKNINLNLIFEPFSRGENGVREEGTGLGLTLVKKILDMNKIKYEVKLNEKVFKFILNIN